LNQSLQIEDQLAAETVGAIGRVPAAESVGWLPRAIGMLTRWIPYQPRVPSSGTTSNAAFDYYLRGRTLFEERTVPSALQAIEYLHKALKEDPNYAAAYATLADVQGVLMDLNYAPHATLLAEAERYINQAAVLGPDVPEVQLTLGLVRQMQWRWQEAEQAYKRAIELHPTLARAHRWYGGLQLQFGLFEESLQKHRYALELDPYDFPSQSALGHALFHAGRAKEAAAALEALLARKDLFYGHAMLGQVYAYLGGAEVDPGLRVEYLNKALQESAIVRRQDGRARVDGAGTVHSVYADLIAVLAWGYQGNPQAAAPFMERLSAARADGRISAGLIARAHAGLKDNTRALEALLDAEAGRERELYYINVSPLYAGLRQDPRFRALVDRIGLSR
jgi:tetratricopeptide (TPR) repeat protein